MHLGVSRISPCVQCSALVITVLNPNPIPWPRKWQFFEGNPPLLIQLMLKLISPPGLSPSAFEVNHSFVFPLKPSRLEHVPGSPRLCQDVQRLSALCAKGLSCSKPRGDFSRMRFQPWVSAGQPRWCQGWSAPVSLCLQKKFSISFIEQVNLHRTAL